MRPEDEIRQVIADIEFVLALPGNGGIPEGVMVTHLHILQWVLGQNTVANENFAQLRKNIVKAKEALKTGDVARERRN
jgi:hypothetical protein